MYISCQKPIIRQLKLLYKSTFIIIKSSYMMMMNSKQIQQFKKNGMRATLYLVNGDEYVGEWKDDKKHGFGKYSRASDGSVYEGSWSEGCRSGQGVLWIDLNHLGPSTNNAMASFADDSESVGKLHRKPKVKLVKSYDGEWLHDKFHGRGVMYYHLTGARYEGEWARGRQNGWGTMFYPNGDRYEGEWLEGKRSGQGVIWLSNGDRYEGSWLNDVKNGSGKYHYNQLKRIYDGEWLQDVAKCGYLRDIASESSPIPPIELAEPTKVMEAQRDHFNVERQYLQSINL